MRVIIIQCFCAKYDFLGKKNEWATKPDRIIWKCEHREASRRNFSSGATSKAPVSSNPARWEREGEERRHNDKKEEGITVRKSVRSGEQSRRRRNHEADGEWRSVSGKEEVGGCKGTNQARVFKVNSLICCWRMYNINLHQPIKLHQSIL